MECQRFVSLGFLSYLGTLNHVPFEFEIKVIG